MIWEQFIKKPPPTGFFRPFSRQVSITPLGFDFECVLQAHGPSGMSVHKSDICCLSSTLPHFSRCEIHTPLHAAGDTSPQQNGGFRRHFTSYLLTLWDAENYKRHVFFASETSLLDAQATMLEWSRLVFFFRLSVLWLESVLSRSTEHNVSWIMQ